MEIKKETEILEGKDAGTSPAEGEVVELNNATVPTPEEEKNAGIVNATSDTEAEPEPTPETEPEQEVESNTDTEADVDPEVPETSATEPMFTQSQVDEIAGKVRKETREKVTKDFFSRYGVTSADELDDLFGDAQRFVTARDEYGEKEKAWKEADELRNRELSELKESVALLSSGIDKNRYEDAKFILRGKGLEVTEENIANELATHPEWKAEQQAQERKLESAPFAKKPEPVTQIKPIDVLGNEGPQTETPSETEYQKAMRMFKV